MTKKKHPLDIFRKKEVEEDESGTGTADGQEESWTHILDSLGVDARAMSTAEIQAIIRNYTEGKQRVSNVYDLSGKKVSSVPSKSKEKSSERYYTLSEDKSGPAQSSEGVKEKEKRSEKADEHKPTGPVVGPKPSGPGLS